MKNKSELDDSFFIWLSIFASAMLVICLTPYVGIVLAFNLFSLLLSFISLGLAIWSITLL